MHVRIAQFHVPPENWNAVVKEVREGVAPAIRQVPGYVASAFVGDRSRDISWGIVFWESEASLRASEEAAAQIRGTAIEGAGLQLTGVERFEVISAEFPGDQAE